MDIVIMLDIEDYFMKPPHFFKAYCRLGLTNVPYRMSEQNFGVEDAPDFILTKDLLSQFPNAQVSEYRFPNPEDVKPDNYWQTLCLHLRGVKLKINQDLKPDETQIIIGGDNSVTFVSLLAVLDRFDVGKVGYIQFDSHGEANSFSGSISKNFHGMYLRPFIDKFDIEVVDSLVPNKLPPENILTIGNQDLDPDEVLIYKKLSIKNFNSDNITQAKAFLYDFIDKFEHIHINFDVDVMDKSITPATGIPADSGLLPEHIWPLLEIIKSHPSWSLDLMEVNLKKNGAEKTIKFAQEVIKFLALNPGVHA